MGHVCGKSTQFCDIYESRYKMLKHQFLSNKDTLFDTQIFIKQLLWTRGNRQSSKRNAEDIAATCILFTEPSTEHTDCTQKKSNE